MIIQNHGKIGEIIIGNNVWIGCNVSILRGTIIGDNSIFVAGSIATKKFRPNSYTGGVPGITFGKIEE